MNIHKAINIIKREMSRLIEDNKINEYEKGKLLLVLSRIVNTIYQEDDNAKHWIPCEHCGGMIDIELFE